MTLPHCCLPPTHHPPAARRPGPPPSQVYDPQKGGFSDVGMLDVQQIFGRAGRPQFEDSGEGIIITSHDRLAHYLGMLTHQAAIESQFKKLMVDNLNAGGWGGLCVVLLCW